MDDRKFGRMYRVVAAEGRSLQGPDLHRYPRSQSDNG